MARKENAAAPQLKNAGRVCEIRVASVLHPPHQDTGDVVRHNHIRPDTCNYVIGNLTNIARVSCCLHV